MDHKYGKIAIARDFAIVLQNNGWNLSFVGQDTFLRRIFSPLRPDNHKFVKLAAGFDGYMALDESGRIHSGPRAKEFERGREIETLEDVVDVVSCEGHTVALHSNGTVTCIDEPMSYEGPTPFANDVVNWHSIVQVACGFDFVAGLKSDGTIVTTGQYYRCPDWVGIVQFDAFNCYYGRIYTIALLNNGNVVADFSDEVSEWHNVVRVCVGNGIAVGLKSDGTSYAIGSEDFVKEVQSWRDIIDIECKFFEAVAILKNGEIVTSNK